MERMLSDREEECILRDFDNYHIFHIHSLRKTLSSFVFNNICSALKADIFSICVFNNFCRHTFKFNHLFFRATVTGKN